MITESTIEPSFEIRSRSRRFLAPLLAAFVIGALGVIGYVVVMCAIGKARQVHALMWVIAPFFLVFFAADWLEQNWP